MDDCTPHEGVTVTYAITVTNHGSSDATRVVLSDTLPLNLTYNSHSGDGTYKDATGRWAVDNLNNGESKTLHITVTVDAGGWIITNTAVVSESSRTDPNVSNNADKVFFNAQESDALKAWITPSASRCWGGPRPSAGTRRR